MRLPVFTLTGDPTKDLGGFRPSPSNFAIDWNFFFLMQGQTRQVGKPQPSYKMDNSLVFPLSLLPVGDTAVVLPRCPSGTCCGVSNLVCRVDRPWRAPMALRRCEMIRS